MKCIIGKKIDMTQVWQGDRLVAVTRIQAGPCTVTQVRTPDRDGYSALQLGFGAAKAKHTAKPQAGHLKGLSLFRTLREFRTKAEDVQRGDVVTVATFAAGDNIAVTGTTKGKGFQGVVRRHGFKGQKATHGNKDQLRMPGASGAGGVQHVFKGTLKPGHMGDRRSTVHNLAIVSIDEEKNELWVSGAVPGARNSLVLVYGDGDLAVQNTEQPTVEEAVTEPVAETVAAEPTPAEPAKEAAPAKEENIETVVIEAKERLADQDTPEPK